MKALLYILSRAATRALVGVSLSALVAQAAPPYDFGYENVRVSGHISTNERPLVVLLVQFADRPALAHDVAWYDDLFFNTSRIPVSVKGAFREMSNDRFSWSRVGTFGPMILPGSQRFENYSDKLLYHSNIVWQALDRQLFSLATFDRDNYGGVTQDELQIVVIKNEADSNGGMRDAGTVPDPHSNKAWHGWIALFEHRSEFALIVHEVFHTLGLSDLYGASQDLNSGLSIIGSGHRFALESSQIFHLDPWYKMQLGWSEPRVYSLRDGGVATIPAAQLMDPLAPILLYDPSRGKGEFFILEYRTTISPLGPGYDANTSGSGLAIWHIQQDTSTYNPTLLPTNQAGSFPAQTLWRFCGKCKGLHFISNDSSPTLGRCPEDGGQHSQDGSFPYMVIQNFADAPGQHNWRWCRKCQGLFFGPGELASHCPESGTHDGSQSGNYSLVQNEPTSVGQEGWKWCYKCQGLFFGPNQSESDCPADNHTHDGSRSGDYSMLVEGGEYVVWTEGAPGFVRGGNRLWGSGAVTPFQHWLDRAETRTRFYVRPFTAGAASITVEWWTEEETWVDFNYVGTEAGTFANPFNTLAEGVEAASWGGIVKLKPGSTRETLPPINKRVTLEAPLAPVTIGQ